MAHAHVTGPLAPAARPAQGEALSLVSVMCICALMSLGLSRAHIPSTSASRVLAPMTVTVAAWTDEEARVRAALASWCSWREMGEVGQVVLGVCWQSQVRWAPNPHIQGPQRAPKRTLNYAVYQDYLICLTLSMLNFEYLSQELICPTKS